MIRIQLTSGFLTFSGDIEMGHWREMGEYPCFLEFTKTSNLHLLGGI